MIENFPPGKPRLLNIGCGSQFHTDWLNIDLVSHYEQVVEYDLRKGIPLEANTCDAVYHSHVLEHLKPAAGQDLITDCFRVLKPGGILRVVVPDLEMICRLYLEKLESAWLGDTQAAADYQWMKLELLDQLVRDQSGGLMGPYMADPNSPNKIFVEKRIGREVSLSHNHHPKKEQKKPSRISNRLAKWKQKFVNFLRKKVIGEDQKEVFQEVEFRNSGEIHRWMYDRLSMRSLLTEVGFGDFQVCQAEESRIEGFAAFHLDTFKDGSKKKPDSLYVEAQKPE